MPTAWCFCSVPWCGKFHPCPNTIPGPSNPWRVVIQTALSWPTLQHCVKVIKTLSLNRMSLGSMFPSCTQWSYQFVKLRLASKICVGSFVSLRGVGRMWMKNFCCCSALTKYILGYVSNIELISVIFCSYSPKWNLVLDIFSHILCKLFSCVELEHPEFSFEFMITHHY